MKLRGLGVMLLLALPACRSLAAYGQSEDQGRGDVPSRDASIDASHVDASWADGKMADARADDALRRDAKPPQFDANVDGGGALLLDKSYLSADLPSESYSAGDPRAPLGVMTITASFTNVSGQSLEGVYFIVTQLGNSGVLLNADGGPSGVGARLTVPAASLGPGGIWQPGTVLQQVFEIGLQTPGNFAFYVDAYGLLAP